MSHVLYFTAIQTNMSRKPFLFCFSRILSFITDIGLVMVYKFVVRVQMYLACTLNRIDLLILTYMREMYGLSNTYDQADIVKALGFRFVK